MNDRAAAGASSPLVDARARARASPDARATATMRTRVVGDAATRNRRATRAEAAESSPTMRRANRRRRRDGATTALTLTLTLALLDAATAMTMRVRGTLETLTRACATSESASFEFTQRDGGATTRCVFAPYDVVREAERASANATAMKAIFVERDANAEIFAQNMVGIDDEGVAAALAANASASADYERAKAVNASAHAAVEAALAIADSGTATQVSASGSEATYGCSIPAGAGGVYAVVAAADPAGGVTDVTKPDSSKTIRRTSLRDYSPKSGPSTGGTVVTFSGDGFNDVAGSTMNCSISDGNSVVVQRATHLPDGTVTCEMPAQSGVIDVKLVYPDSCYETAQFLYYQNPDVLLVIPRHTPRFGRNNFSAYATNTYYASQYGPGGSDATHAGKVNVTCALGMGTSSNQTASAIAVVPGVVSASGQAITCMVPDITIPMGTHDVRVSYNGQQYMLPNLVLTDPSKVSIVARGPVLRTKHYYSTAQNGNEDARVIAVPVELEGVNRRLVSVGVNVTYGGISQMPGTSGDQALVQVTHASARDNATDAGGDYDFSVSPTTLHWMAGESGENFVYVRIRNDRVHENALEALTLTLVDAMNADIETDFKNKSAVVTIADDDPAPLFGVRARNVAFPPLYRYSQETVKIPIDIIGGGNFALPAVIDYEIVTSGAASSAVAGVHYAAATGRLTWMPGDYGKTQYAEVVLDWSNIPSEASLRLHVNLTAVSESRVAAIPSSFVESEDAALFIFGVPPGSCPPGTRRTDPTTYVAPPPVPQALSPPPPSPPPPSVSVDSAILSLSVVANTTVAMSSVFPYVPDGIAIQPAFDPTRHTYTATVPHGVTGVQVFYQFRQSTTSITTTLSARRRLLAASLVNMKYFTLNQGDNVIRLITTSPNGQSSETYRLTIERLAMVANPPSPPPPPPAPPSPPPPPPWTHPSPPPPEGALQAPPAPPAPPAPTPRPTEPRDNATCTYCSAGSFASDMNSLQCQLCPPGSASPSVLTKACVQCPQGMYMAESGATQCLQCPRDAFANVTGARLCTPCPRQATTSTAGSTMCNVSTAPVDRAHPDVFYVDVVFGVSFHQAGGSLANMAANIGVDADANSAFVRAMEIDVATKFNVTRGSIRLNVAQPGATASTPAGRRRLLQSGSSVSVTCSASQNCIRAVVVTVTMQATEMLRFGVVRDYETTKAAIDATRAQAAAILLTLRSDPVAFFSTTTAGIGGVVQGQLYEDPSGSLIVEKEPTPPRGVPNVFGDVNVALIVVSCICAMFAAFVAYTLLRRTRARRMLTKIENEVIESEKRRVGVRKVKDSSKVTATVNKATWKKVLAQKDAPDDAEKGEVKKQIQMREQSQITLAHVSRFKQSRESSAIEKMWQARNERAAIGVGIQRVKR